MGNGVEEKWIDRAEQALSLKLPASFQYFLLKYGGGYVGGEYIIDLCDLEPEPEILLDDFVQFTLLERQNGGLNPSYVLIVNNDGDQQFYLDTYATTDDNECRIVEVNMEEGNTPKLYAESFADFLLKRINFHLGDAKGF